MTDIDAFINQIDTFTDQQFECKNCKQLEEQITVYMEVIKEQESQICNYENQQSQNLELAKEQLRSEMERKIREKLVIQLKEQLSKELRPQVILDIKTRYLEQLTEDEKVALTNNLRQQIYKQCMIEAKNKLEPEVQNRLKEEKEKLRVKLSEVQILKENLESESKIKLLDTKHKKEIQNIHNLHSREVANLKVQNSNSKKKIQDLMDQLNQKEEKFFIEKERLEQEVINLSKLKENISDQMQEQLSRSIQYENQSAQVIHNLISSQVSDKSRFGFNSGIISQMPLVSPDSSNNACRVNQTQKSPELNNRGQQQELFKTVQFISPSVLEKQSISPIQHPASVMQVSAIQSVHPQINRSNNRFKQIVQDHFDSEKLQQQIFNNLDPINLTNNKVGNMLESAFQFVFDYWDKVEESFKVRNNWMRLISEQVNNQRYDQALKLAQQELLRLRDLDRKNHQIYKLITQREAEKDLRDDRVLNEKILRIVASDIIKYRGIDYKIVMQAENVFE